jgi:flavin-dependent dehydrogenase
VLPSLESPAWRKNRLAGEGWLAAGDAGGLVDPITGEGIYFALRSGELASQALLDESIAPEARPALYRELVHRDFMADLAFGATLARKVFLGRVMVTSVPDAMVRLVRRSQRFHDLMQDLFAGTQPYLELPERLWRNMHGPLPQMLFNFFFQRRTAAAE